MSQEDNIMKIQSTSYNNDRTMWSVMPYLSGEGWSKIEKRIKCEISFKIDRKGLDYKWNDDKIRELMIMCVNGPCNIHETYNDHHVDNYYHSKPYMESSYLRISKDTNEINQRISDVRNKYYELNNFRK